MSGGAGARAAGATRRMRRANDSEIVEPARRIREKRRMSRGAGPRPQAEVRPAKAASDNEMFELACGVFSEHGELDCGNDARRGRVMQSCGGDLLPSSDEEGWTRSGRSEAPSLKRRRNSRDRRQPA
jgi:hypothetical protein